MRNILIVFFILLNGVLYCQTTVENSNCNMCDNALQRDIVQNSNYYYSVLSEMQNITEEQYRTLSKEINATITIPVFDIPINFGGNYEQYKNEISKFNNVISRYTLTNKSSSNYINTLSNNALEYWYKCIKELCGSYNGLEIEVLYNKDEEFKLNLYYKGYFDSISYNLTTLNCFPTGSFSGNVIALTPFTNKSITFRKEDKFLDSEVQILETGQTYMNRPYVLKIGGLPKEMVLNKLNSKILSKDITINSNSFFYLAQVQIDKNQLLNGYNQLVFSYRIDGLKMLSKSLGDNLPYTAVIRRLEIQPYNGNIPGAPITDEQMIFNQGHNNTRCEVSHEDRIVLSEIQNLLADYDSFKLTFYIRNQTSDNNGENENAPFVINAGSYFCVSQRKTN